MSVQAGEISILDRYRTIDTSVSVLTTLEVRWILPGPVPEAMIGWLGPFDDWIEQREDRYLVDRGSDLGIKIKDGARFDVKALQGRVGRLAIQGVGRGHLELWEKWSFPLPAGEVPPLGDAGWISLQKSRRRRSFSVGDRVVVERPLAEAELPGCSIELTDVARGGRRWWTLGFEAIGAPETLEETLRATVGWLIDEPSPEPKLFDLRRSMSYPRWLSRGRGTRRREPAPDPR
jgi:hypothetical protein